MTEHKEMPTRTRNVGVIHTEIGEDAILIDHVYFPDGSFDCDECGKPGHDPGLIGLIIDSIENDDRQGRSTLLSAEEALVLANRLTRAANLVLESQEDVPDVEREIARFDAASKDAG